MSQQKIFVFLVFFCLFRLEHSLAQITSTSTLINECAPANITFTAPAGASSVSWNFGAYGSFNTSTGSFNVLTAASFSAVFSGIVGGNPVSFTVPVVVHAVPVANFNIAQPSNGCAPVTVTLTDQSVTSSTLQSWKWVYGDGNLNTFTTGSPHTYIYTALGSWSVTLVVTDIHGCDDQKTIGPITVTSPPAAVISSNPPILTGCTSNFSAVFSASNSVGSGLTYAWNFGNSQTSNLVTTASITFTSQTAQYPVTLTVTANGCNAIASTFVTVSPPTLSVTLPASVCLNSPGTATILTNQPFTTWNFGGSNSTNVLSPAPGFSLVNMPVFTSAGLQSFTITAGALPCITPPSSHTVFVEQVTANFSSSSLPLIDCSPLVASYTNLSSGNATQFVWTYENYAQTTTFTSTLTNPTFTYTQGSLNAYTMFYSTYTPTVSLLAMSASGCSATVSHTFHSVRQPTAWFNKNVKQGCAPLAVTLSDSSFVFPADPIASYTWCNGENPPVFISGTGTNIPSQLFTYTATGTYSPYLIITTAGGCTDMSFIDEVIVANPPTISFNVSSTNICPNQALQITNTSPSQSLIAHWHVESDNGFFSGCVDDPNPSWKFTNTGTHTISLSGYQNGCKGTTVLSQSILVKGPIVNFRYETNCTNRKSVVFYSELQEVQTATLNFGDNTSLVITGNQTGLVSHTSAPHTYSASGDYTVSLTGMNAATGCPTSIFTRVVRVRDVMAAFSMPPVGCAGASVLLNALSSNDVYTGCSIGYVWYIDNLPPVTDVAPFYSTSFSSMGTHTVTLMVKDLNACMDTDVQTIRISSVSPVFSSNTNTVCLSTGTIQLTNTSSQLPDPISSYTWNFGNGQTYTTTQLSVPIVTYTNAAVPSTSFLIVLTASNAVGCVQSTSRVVNVILPAVNIYASPQNVCMLGTTPSTVSFTSLNSNASYTLNYGAGPSSTLITSAANTVYSYSLAGVYVMSMTVKTSAGCENTGNTTINVVNTPTANFLFESPGSTGGNSICSGNIVTFTNNSVPQAYEPTWNLGSGVLTNTNNVVTRFYSSTSTSVVAVSLTVNTGAPAFCKSNVVKNFTIYASSASIALSKTVVCLNESIQLNVVNPIGVSAWIWDFGDATPSGTVFANSTPAPTTFTMHTYSNYTATAAGNTSVSLIYWSMGEACKLATPSIPLKIIKIDPDFKRNKELEKADSIHCLYILDTFENISSSNSSSLTYTWNFSNGFSTNSISPSYVFPSAGVQQVSLNVTDINNCKVQAVKNITIYPLPTVSLSSGFHCPNVPFPLFAEGSAGVNSGTWSPASSIVGSPTFTTTQTSYSVSAMASENRSFVIAVTDTNKCIGFFDTTLITILQPPLPINWDTTVIIGEAIPLNGYLGNYTYTWNPVIKDLSCITCYNPISNSTVDIVYTMIAEDSLQCARVSSTFTVNVLPRSSVDVPDAFTPNGDGKNDVLYVGGWGIKKLNYFKVFNRYGQLIFESNDINVGWNGDYNAVPQNMETYVYQVSVETFIDKEPLLKSGTFKLIR